MEILGIDFGGSGIKGAIVDVVSGEMVTPRHRIETPKGAKPKDVAEVMASMVEHFAWKGVVGCGMPAVVQRGVVRTAANIDEKWIGTNAVELFSEATGCPFYAANDADVAGIAEMTYGAGKGRDGVVIMLTLGTGIGTAFFSDGVLLPNTEFGHLKIRGKDAEHRASAAQRTKKKLGWKVWSKRLQEYLVTLEDLLWPDLFIIGGGVSKRSEKFFPYLKLRTEIVPAQMENGAGVIGAAMYANQGSQKSA